MNVIRLYQHSARCPVALRAFLECNTVYCRFVSQLWNEPMPTNFDFMGEPVNRESKVGHLVQNSVIKHRKVGKYLQRVPLPPAQYIFSHQQRQQQRFFFRNMASRVCGIIPYRLLDLHQVKIIAV
ncbi:unnamed protein product, partial [Rotaria socialis]